MCEIKVTHKEVQDIRTGLGLQMYISSTEIQWELYQVLFVKHWTKR